MSEQNVSTETIWKLLSEKLRGFIRSRVSDDQVAQDLLQETFLRIHRKLSEIKEDERIEPWAFQIARNLITDYYRAKKPRGYSVNIDPAAEDFDADNINTEVASWLPLMIELLPEKYREAVRMYEIEGVPQQEIAQRLGMSLSGAKSRVQRGRDQLRKVLNDCCAFEIDRRGNVLDYQPNASEECCDLKNITISDDVANR